MNCSNCGHQNTDGATVCSNCGAALNTAPPASPESAAPPSPPPAAPAYDAAVGSGDIQAPPPNHMVWAIISTVVATLISILACCCLPLGLAPGIPAIIFANKVNTMLAAGDYHGAKAASDNAKTWSLVTTIFGAVVLVLWIVMLALNLMGIVSEDYLQDLVR